MQKILSLKPGREKALINRHPWVYSGALKKVPDDLQDGDVVTMVDSHGKMLALGHYVPQKSISCRIFHFGSSPLSINDDFWLGKMRKALAYRQELGLIPSKDSAYRLFFSEADELPGLVCDIFADTAVLQLRTAGMLAIKLVIARFLEQELSIKHIFIRGEHKNQNEWLLGNRPEVLFNEGNVQLIADIEQGQKTGFFIDQRDNRLLLQKMAAKRTVLNAFSYSGGFSVHALKGGAHKVVSVDISAEAIALCNRSIAQNNFSSAQHEGVTADCFEYLRQMPANIFDLIVLDPPAFAKNPSSVAQAARGYKDINLHALRQIRSGGLLFTFSCSHHISRDLFRKIIFGACADAKRSVRVVQELSAPADHPVSIYHPEGEYLKGLVLYVD